VVARVAGVEFARFHVDLSSGDALVGIPDVLVGSDLLDFAGVVPLQFPAYPLAQHLAEKLHAHTLPRVGTNTRTKDLVDLVVIAAQDAVNGSAVLASVQATFSIRATHDIPKFLPEPDPSWEGPFRVLTAQSPISPTTDLRQGYALAARFWNPVLSSRVHGLSWAATDSMWNAKMSASQT
jgi:hypothetical protein